MTESTETAPIDEETSLLDLLQVVVDNLRVLVLVPLAVGVLALAITYAIPPTFTATVKFLPPQQQQSAAATMLQNLGVLGGLAGVSTGIRNPNDQFVALLKSRSMQDALIDKYQLHERYGDRLKVDTRKTLGDNTRITVGKEGLIAIEVDDKDPAFAATLANAHVAEFQKLLGRLALTEAQQRRAFFEAQLARVNDNLAKAEAALKASGVNASSLKSAPAATIAALAQLQAQIAAQEVKVASMRGYLADTAPLFKQAQTELAAYRNQLSKAEHGSEQSKDNQGIDADYVVRYREFKYQETLLELFAKQLELAKVDESREGAAIQVVDAAEPPERKSKPKRAFVAILVTLGTGILLLVYFFVRNALESAKRDQKSAQRITQLSRAWTRAIGRSGV